MTIPLLAISLVLVGCNIITWIALFHIRSVVDATANLLAAAVLRAVESSGPER